MACRNDFRSNGNKPMQSSQTKVFRRITLLAFCLSTLAACALPTGATWCNSGRGICEADGVTRWSQPNPWGGAGDSGSDNDESDNYTPPD
jgi:hypothetical protein